MTSEERPPTDEAPKDEAPDEAPKDEAPEAPADEAPEVSADEASADEAPEAPADEAPAASDDDPLELLWRRALEEWDDDKRHAALLELALSAERLPDLAGKYRSLEKDPERGARAKKRLDAIVMAATQMLLAMKTPPPPKSNKTLTIATAVVCAALVSYLMWTILQAR